ncbi:ABC transporter ATP-binding protein [Fredinandcohnia sp. FSL W7-1320]|uniref:ABC transporter ATP-binding protein n=1 Tax=Fredinandcohnia sp. FSL W7-1320 TaxID=2954540 RepID=UPI0030FDC770
MDQSKKHSFYLLMPYIKRYSSTYILLFVLLIMGVFLDLFFAWFLKSITDSAVAGDFEKVKWYFLLGALLIITNVIISFFNAYLQSVSVNKIKKDIKTDIFNHLLCVSNNYFNRVHSGDIVSRLNNDANSIGGAIGSNIINLIRHPLAALVSFIYLLTINWQLSLLTLLLGPSALLLGKLFGKALRLNSKKIHIETGRVNSFLQDTFSGRFIVKVFGLEQYISNQFQNDSERILLLELKDGKLRGGLQGSVTGVGSMSFMVSLGLGAFFVVNGTLSIGSLLAFVSLLQNITSPFTGMANIWADFQRSLSAVERLFSLLEIPKEMELFELSKKHEEKDLNKDIKLEEISFSYEGKNIIKDLSLTISKGDAVAIVGPSGSGKSTLFQLLLGLSKPDKGRIFIDGKSIGELTISELRSYFSIVPQDTYLFNGSIKENISFGKYGASEKEIIEAANIANAHKFIMELNDDYNTQVGERGTRLSGGQKQRISIARAVLKDAPILLLDEATSALDSESEQVLQESLDQIMKDKTTIIIAHRLSTIKNANIILVMDDGKVTEMGSHEELLRKSGTYARLYHLQISNGTEGNIQN